MPASPIHFAIIHSGAASLPDEPRVLHFSVGENPRIGAPVQSALNLLVLDARRMSPACTEEAFRSAAHLQRAPGYKHCVLVCTVPLLPLIVGAMRAGLRDIIHERLTARQLLRLLRVATPEHRASAWQISSLAAIMRILALSERASPPSAQLARREYALVQRSEQLTHTETRLALDRAALEDREHKLRASNRRIEREWAVLQKDADRPPVATTPTATPFSAHPFSDDLQTIAALLSERADALDIRERMLTEMESLLTAQLTAVGA